MFTRRKNVKYTCNYSLPSTKLRNIFCTQCKRQFFLEEFVPLHGLVPLLLDCGHMICNGCVKTFAKKPCSVCNTISQCEDQAASLPLNIYALGLMIMSQNRPVNMDDSDISFSKSLNSKSKQLCKKDFCHECGIEAKIHCPKCPALYCIICYSKIHGKALQSHPKIMLSEGRSANSFAIQNTCSERCNEPLGYYCENCEIVGCSHCMLRSHKRHSYLSLLQKNEELLPEFYSAIKRVRLSLQEVREGQKKLKPTELYPTTNAQNVDTVESTITQHFAYLHGVLQNTEKKVISSLQEQRNARNQNIDEISKQLSNHEDRLQSALMVTELATSNIDKINIQQVIEKLQSLIDIPCSVTIDPASGDPDVKLNIDNSIADSIEKHCSVYVPKASSYSLQQMKLLPKDYETEPLDSEINIPNDTGKSTEMEATSSVSLPAVKGDNLPTVGSTETVRISHIVDPSYFYAQLAQNKHKLTELTRGLTTFAETTANIPTEVTLNALYVVQCFKDRSWYRSRVTDKKVDSHGDEKFNVLFIDFGMKEENVPLSRVRNIIPQYSMLPIMALRCTLYDVVPNHGKWHPDATQAFKKLVSTNMMTSMRIMMITGDTYYVDLCVISSKDARMISMRESLTYMNYATCVSPNKLMRMNPGSTRTYYKEQLEMEAYTHVQILFIESPSSIYVQKTHANRSYFTKLVTEMTADYKENKSALELIATPYKDMPCAAIGVDGFWHRGLICEVTEITVKVFYVDFGYTLILNHDDVRVLSKKYMTCKTQAIKIALRSIKTLSGHRDDWAPEATEFLEKVLMNAREIKIIAFDKFGDTYSAVMYTHDKENVAGLLIKNSLALHIGANSQNASTSHKYKNKRNKYKKNHARDEELPGELYDVSASASVKSKNESENDDPFKVCVVVHQAQSPDCIYVSDATYNHPDMEEMMRQMQEFYGKYRSTKRDVWNVDDTCVIYSARSDMYYRARVINVKSTDNVLVFLYDIGTEETVPINDMQSLHPMYSKISTYVFKIKLTGILPCGGSNTWPSLSCEKLQEIINGKQNCKFYISKVEEEGVEDSAIPAELWIKQVKMDGPLEPTRHEINSVNRMLVEQGVALPVKEYAKRRDKILAIELKRQLKKRLKRLTSSESNVKWFEISTELDNSIEANINEKAPKRLLPITCSDSDEDYNSDELLIIPSLPVLSSWLPVMPILDDNFIAIPTNLDQNGFLYLHSKTQHAEILQYIEMKLGKLYNDCPTESCDTVWAAGDMCIVQYHANKKWYRGKVVKVEEDDIIKVEFVDYGNVEECSIGTIKKKVVLERIPIQCTKCLIYGFVPGTENGKWLTEDLDRIHSLLIEQECEVTVLDRIDTNLVISVTIYPNNYCTKKCDLISFLADKWKMNIKPSMDITMSEKSISTTGTPDVVIENSRLLCSDDEIIKNAVISGNSVLVPHTSNLDKAASETITDIANLSWHEIKKEVITSTPSIVSEESLAINYKTINISDDIEYIEIELCCSISTTEFYAQLKENTHSEILNTYYLEYESLMSDLQEFADKQPMITSFTPNTPCCAKFDDDELWYRCLIIESDSVIDSDDVEVKLLFIDYGNSEYRTVNPQQCDLYALKTEWFDLPAMSIKCVLWNITLAPDVDYNVLIPQLNKLYNKQVVATIKDIGEEVISVELYEDIERKELMYNSLIVEGLLKLEAEIN